MTQQQKRIMIGICISLAVAAIVFAVLWTAAHRNDRATGDGVDSGTVPPRIERTYIPVLSTAKNIQADSNSIYFAGAKNGIFKYDISTDQVSDYCTDPLCNHHSQNASCRIDNYQRGMFFRANNETMLYNAAIVNDKYGKITPHLYRFDPAAMSNMLLDSSASFSNHYTVSDEYVYFTNTVVKSNKTYFNLKQINLTTGNIKIFGEEREGAPAYTLIGAVNGKLYAADADSGATYVCNESDPGSFTLFWERVISYVYAGNNDLFFKSRDPHDDTPKDKADYYYYRTDCNGNIISKHKLNGGMKWGSIFDGRNLYYIPSVEEDITLPDGSIQKMHPRVIYKLDTVTGNETVAFSFTGDFAALSIGFDFNDLIVYNNKIFTAELTGKVFSDDAAGNTKSETLSLKNGIVIIDMTTADITYITAGHVKNAVGDTELSLKRETIHMDR